MNFAELEQKLKEVFRKCLTCDKMLDDKMIIKNQSRCKKCNKKYEIVWFKAYTDFLRIFKDAD